VNQSERYDVAVIGSGPGGYRAAVLASLRGLKVAIVEKDLWGGCCLNRGCVPKMAWYEAACALAAQPRWRRMGVEAAAARGDLARAWMHQREVVDTIRANYLDYLRRLGVTAVEGAASFESSGMLVVGQRRIEAAHVVVATGASAHVPPGLARVPGKVLTTDDLFDGPLPPGRRVALVGAGVVATELAFILSLLGCEVLWYARTAPLARRAYTEPARAVLDRALAGHGLSPRPFSGNLAALPDAGAVDLHLGAGDTVRVDWVLLGTGRRPHTDGLGLERAGVELDDRGFVVVDEHGATNQSGIHAIGDVVNERMTSNLALADAAVVVASILQPGSRRRRPDWVPEVVYSAVELARIGLNEDEAEARGHETATGFASFGVEPAAMAAADTEGFVRIVADADDASLLGAEIAGTDAGTLVQIVEQAARARHPLASLARAAQNHPGRAESILNAVETLGARWGLGDAVFGTPDEP